MKIKIKNLAIFYKNSPDTPNYVYEKTETSDKNDKKQETVKELGKIDGNVDNLNSLLERLNNWKDNSEMVCNILNQTIEKDNWAHFQIVNNKWKKEIWLVIDKSQKDAKTILSSINNSIKKDKKDEYFFDKNSDNKKDVWELSVDKKWKITGVDIKGKEKRSYANTKEFFKWKYYKDRDKFVYEVWKTWDKWAAILRQVVALWDELWIKTKDYSKIKKEIENLYVDTSWNNVIFSKHKLEGGNGKQVKDLKITIKWKNIKWIDALNYKVHTWDKIDISSLDAWLGSKKFEAKLDNTATIKKEKPTTKDTVENKEKSLWTFYTSWGVEYWDLLDNANITYEKSNWSKINTDGKNLQINAQNLFDTENKGNNKFSKSIEIWKWKNKSYLVVWENVSGKSIDFNSITPDNCKQKLKDSWLEAWLASYDEKGNKKENMHIQEVWDPKVHEFIRVNNFSDAWKSVNNPIYLEGNKDNYTFQREIDWKESNITFSKGWISDILKNKKSWESITLKSWDDKLNKEQWNNKLQSIFWKDLTKKDIDWLFNHMDWDEMFIEFENLYKNKDGTLEDVTLKFENTQNGELKITKISQEKERTLTNREFIWLFPKYEINEINTRCEIIKSIDNNKIETRSINNLWYPSFIVSKNKKGNLVFTKDWKNNWKKDNYTFEVRWFNKWLDIKDDFIDFFNKDFMNIIFAASSPGNIKKAKKWWKDIFYMDKSSIEGSNKKNISKKEANKDYVKEHILWPAWDKFIQEAIKNAKPENKKQK